MKSLLSMSLMVAVLAGCGKDIGDVRSNLSEDDAKSLSGSFATVCNRNTDSSSKMTLKFEGNQFTSETIQYFDRDCTESARIKSEVYTGTFLVAATEKAHRNSIAITFSDAYSITRYLPDTEDSVKAAQALRNARNLALAAEVDQKSRELEANPEATVKAKAKLAELKAQATAVANLPDYAVNVPHVLNTKAARGLQLEHIAKRLQSQPNMTYQVNPQVLFLSPSDVEAMDKDGKPVDARAGFENVTFNRI